MYEQYKGMVATREGWLLCILEDSGIDPTPYKAKLSGDVEVSDTTGADLKPTLIEVAVTETQQDNWR